MKEIAKELLNKKKMSDFLLNELLGRFIGFIVGMSTSSLFTKVVYEKKGIGNLFGLAKRKKIIVNTTPEWLQFIISVIIGYIALELVNYFFKHKLYSTPINFIKKKIFASSDEKSVISNDIEKS